MKELILVRHGLAQHLVKGMTGGWTDLPLTELGREQSLRTGERLARIIAGRACELYSSDLHRARQTAEILARFLAVEPRLAPDLRDVNNGIAANLSRAEADTLRRPMTQPLMDWIPFPHAESWRMMMQRAGAFVHGLEARPAEVVVLVSHRNVISALIQWWLRFSEDLISTTDFEADPCSLACLTTAYWGGRVLTKLNDTSHLDASSSSS